MLGYERSAWDKENGFCSNSHAYFLIKIQGLKIFGIVKFYKQL